MENPFEIVLEKLNSIENAVEKLNGSSNNNAYTLLPDAENNFPYFSRIINFSGTVMVQSEVNYHKIKQSFLIKIT
jgi:hypothetical protein